MGRICIEDLKGAKHHSLYCNCVVVLYISGTYSGYINFKKTHKISHLCGRKKKRDPCSRKVSNTYLLSHILRQRTIITAFHINSTLENKILHSSHLDYNESFLYDEKLSVLFLFFCVATNNLFLFVHNDNMRGHKDQHFPLCRYYSCGHLLAVVFLSPIPQ